MSAGEMPRGWRLVPTKTDHQVVSQYAKGISHEFDDLWIELSFAGRSHKGIYSQRELLVWRRYQAAKRKNEICLPEGRDENEDPRMTHGRVEKQVDRVNKRSRPN
jgi:hypothetical protein